MIRMSVHVLASWNLGIVISCDVSASVPARLKVGKIREQLREDERTWRRYTTVL